MRATGRKIKSAKCALATIVAVTAPTNKERDHDLGADVDGCGCDIDCRRPDDDRTSGLDDATGECKRSEERSAKRQAEINDAEWIFRFHDEMILLMGDG
jgi:hypothetical protein